jgi:hypothetical protein
MIQVSDKTSNLRHSCLAEFLYGFAFLWHNDSEKSIPPMEASLEIAEKIGDVVLQTRNLTYLTLAHRRLEQLDAVRNFARRSLKLAEMSGMSEYIGTACANLEPELEEQMKAVISRFKAGETVGIHEEIEGVLKLAEKYRYL